MQAALAGRTVVARRFDGSSGGSYAIDRHGRLCTGDGAGRGQSLAAVCACAVDLDPEERIAHAVLTGLDVAGKLLLEAWIRFDGDAEIIPTVGVLQPPMPDQILVGWQRPLHCALRVGIEHLQPRRLVALVFDLERDAMVEVEIGLDAEVRFVPAVDAPGKRTQVAVRS